MSADYVNAHGYFSKKDPTIFDEDSMNSEVNLILIIFGCFIPALIFGCYKYCTHRNADDFLKSESCPEFDTYRSTVDSFPSNTSRKFSMRSQTIL